MTNQIKGILWYLVIAFVISWISILGIYLLGGTATSNTSMPTTNPLIGILSMLGTFGPAIGAFVTLKWITREGFKEAGLRFNFRAGWPYYLWAVLAPIAACGLAIALAGMVGMDVWLGALKPETVITWIVGTLIWTPILFGEEFGWRGYLQHRLAPNNPLLAAILMGLIWGIWHYAHVLAGIVMDANPLALLIYPFFCIAISILLGWLRTKSQSVWPACLAHAVGNVIVTGAVGSTLSEVPEISTLIFRVVGYAVMGLILVLTQRVSRSVAATAKTNMNA